MFKTLRISFSLKNSYRVNSILYSIKQLPILKKVLPAGIYQVRFFKIFANILSIMWEVISAFFGKLFYFLVMIFLPVTLYDFPTVGPDFFLHIFIFLTIIGAYANTYMFDPKKDKYYAMILLGMDARQYTLVNYVYSLFKLVLAFGLFGTIFGSIVGLKIYECLLIPFAAAGLKMTFASLELRVFEKRETVRNENKKVGIIGIFAMFLLFGIAYLLPMLNIVMHRNISFAVMCLFVLLGLASIPKILKFKNYRAMYKKLLSEGILFDQSNTEANLHKEASRKSISTDTDIQSSKTGFEYLNELFIKRHRKILWKPSVYISLIAAAILAAVLILIRLEPTLKEELNEIMMTFLPYFVFVMYIINRGTSFTQALFINCDNSLLTYSFYKKRKFILKLFQIRLREIIKVNLLPASVIGAGLALLLYFSGGTDNPLDYAILFISIICMSIFFSVHYLTLYYLLQPYNAGTEIKSGAYQLCMSATYIVCYIMLQIKLPTFMFGLMTIIFCVLYCIVASILVFLLAPKTFRIRN